MTSADLLIRSPPIPDRADHVGAEAHPIVLNVSNCGHEGMAMPLLPAAEDSHACCSILRRALSAPPMLPALRKREAHGKSHAELGGNRTNARLSNLFEHANDCFCPRPQDADSKAFTPMQPPSQESTIASTSYTLVYRPHPMHALGLSNEKSQKAFRPQSHVEARNSVAGRIKSYPSAEGGSPDSKIRDRSQRSGHHQSSTSDEEDHGADFSIDFLYTARQHNPEAVRALEHEYDRMMDQSE